LQQAGFQEKAQFLFWSDGVANSFILVGKA
jgi:hypothetical protein